MKINRTLLTIVVLCLGCSKAKDAVTPVVPNKVYFFGDSITVGLGASAPANRWTSKLCAAKGWVETNEGVNGESLLQASETSGFGTFFERYKSDIPSKGTSGKYLFIAYGANDCGLNFNDYTTATFSTQLQTIITYANGRGWTNNSIVVLCGYFESSACWSNPFLGNLLPAAASMDRYNSFIAAAQTVAQANAGVYFVDPFNSYDATQQSNDHVHPDDAGYAAIAAYVGSQVP